MFSAKEEDFIVKRGSQLDLVKQQVQYFKEGFPFLNIKAAATINEGVLKLEPAEVKELVEFFDSKSSKTNLLKFVPASGAASRMFKDLFATLDTGQLNDASKKFFEGLPNFAFYKSLLNAIGGYGENEAILKGLLTKEGLEYGSLPKGLLEFHSYGDITRTPFEEHLVEGALYANRNGRVKIHFTVSPEHKTKFKNHLAEKKEFYENKYGVKYIITFSVQKKSTDTIAVNKDNSLFVNPDGSLLFRPAGHGALLENLNDLKADVVFIKNIDNVVPDSLKEETITYKKALAAVLLKTQKTLFAIARNLDKETVSTYMVQKAARFLKKELGVKPPTGFRNWSFESKLEYVKAKINRPLRVCGMVKNVGEPGGGPFWVKNQDGSLSLQIAETAQINLKSKRQQTIVSESSHFNPVDLIVSTKNYKKEKFDLLKFRDPLTGFITEKSKDGKVLKAQELPGLWNGAMANWNTIFVEVPIETFNPVKTVNDLLRPQHQ